LLTADLKRVLVAITLPTEWNIGDIARAVLGAHADFADITCWEWRSFFAAVADGHVTLDEDTTAMDPGVAYLEETDHA
jgi:hypothetical protein